MNRIGLSAIAFVVGLMLCVVGVAILGGTQRRIQKSRCIYSCKRCSYTADLDSTACPECGAGLPEKPALTIVSARYSARWRLRVGIAMIVCGFAVLAVGTPVLNAIV